MALAIGHRQVAILTVGLSAEVLPGPTLAEAEVPLAGAADLEALVEAASVVEVPGEVGNYFFITRQPAKMSCRPCFFSVNAIMRYPIDMMAEESSFPKKRPVA